MSFLHPEFLYLMLPPLFILFALLLTQKEADGYFFSDEVMEKLRVSANTLTLKARNALFLLIGILLIISLAGPVVKNGTIKVKAKSADIMIALDISDSMLAEDVYPNRLKLAKAKAMSILKAAPDERIGVVAFAKNSYLVSPMSFDHDAVGFLLDKLSTDSITEKGTDFLSLLNVVNKSVKKEGEKYLLLFSDGGDSSDFSKEIAYAKENNIVVYILGIGTQKGVPIKLNDGNFIKHNGEIIISKLNENISELATSSGGIYIQSVKSDDDIKAMLREIESSSEQRELKSEEIQKFIPLFYYPLGMALFLLLIATSSMSKREKVHLPSVFLLFSLLFSSVESEAGLLDFMELKEAKEAYEKGDFEKSEKIYSKYAESSKNGESYYNHANSLYKQGKYSQALESYKKATFDDKESRAGNFANIGNAHVKLGGMEELQKAVESYEKSLKLKEDKEVRENLEAVKKALEKQKQEQKENQEKDKNKEDKKDSEDSGENKDDSQEKESSKDEKNSSKSEKSKDEKSEDSDDSNSKKEQEDEKNKENNEGESKKKQDELKELQKQDNKENKGSGSTEEKQIKPNEMSDAEEQKWLERLNMQQNSYMYKLNENKPIKRDEDEKPW